MNKLILVFVFSINYCFSQTSTEKWNEYKKQYEYFDSNGNMTAYKVYNSNKNQWETYNVNSNSGYQIQPAQQSVNVPLVQKTLSTLQGKYDNNLIRVKNNIQNIYTNIDYIIIKEMTYGEPKELDYKYSERVKNIFYTDYIKNVENKKYDFSNNSLTDNVIIYLKEGSIQTIMQELSFLKAEVPERYNYLIEKYKSLLQ